MTAEITLQIGNTLEARVGGWAFRVPVIYNATVLGDDLVVYTRKEPRPGVFADNIVVSTYPVGDALIAEVSAAALAESRGDGVAVHVCAVEQSPVGGNDGRLHDELHGRGKEEVSLRRYLGIDRGWAIEITGMATASTLEYMYRMIQVMAETAVMDPTWEPGEELAGLLPPEFSPQPRDERAHVGRRADLEDLSPLRTSQAYIGRGPVLSRLAAELLVAPGPHKRRDRLPDNADPQARHELYLAGYVNGEGFMTAQAAPFRAVTGEGPVPEFSITLRQGARRSTLRILVWRTGAVAVAGPSAGELLGEASPPQALRGDQVRVDVIHPRRLQRLVLSWLGLGPAWALGWGGYHQSKQLVMPLDDFNARVQDPTRPLPATFSPLEEHVWHLPWLGATVNAASLEAPRDLLLTGVRGSMTVADAGVSAGRAMVELVPQTPLYEHVWMYNFLVMAFGEEAFEAIDAFAETVEHGPDLTA